MAWASSSSHQIRDRRRADHFIKDGGSDGVFAATDRPVPITADGPVSSSNGWTFAVRGPEGPWVGPDGDYTHARDFKAACERELADTVARAARKAA